MRKAGDCLVDSGEDGYEAGEIGTAGGEAKFTCFWDEGGTANGVNKAKHDNITGCCLRTSSVNR